MSSDELMAFGDANNDKDMLELNTVIMANSSDASLLKLRIV